MIMPPCMKDNVPCPNKSPGCHAKCAEYLAYKEKRNAEGNARKKREIPDSFRAEYISDVKDRLRKQTKRSSI